VGKSIRNCAAVTGVGIDYGDGVAAVTAVHPTLLPTSLADVTEAFSRLAMTTADLSALLRSVESDQTLVHGAYYTDDECIDRIADWIVGAGTEKHLIYRDHEVA